MKQFFRSAISAAGVVFGYMLGKSMWDAIANPVNRAKAKKKLKNVKDAVLKKEED